MPLVGIVLSVGASTLYGFPTGLIVLGATVLLVAIWNLWVSLQLVAGDKAASTEGIDAGAPSTEQEQKAYLLRALEDLEFERNVGKIDEDDYRRLRDQYRTQAKKALSSKVPNRTQAEALVRGFLEEQGISNPKPTQSSDESVASHQPNEPLETQKGDS